MIRIKKVLNTDDTIHYA